MLHSERGTFFAFKLLGILVKPGVLNLQRYPGGSLRDLSYVFGYQLP